MKAAAITETACTCPQICDGAAPRTYAHLLMIPSVDLEYLISAAIGTIVTPMIARSRYDMKATPQLSSMTACHAELWLGC